MCVRKAFRFSKGQYLKSARTISDIINGYTEDSETDIHYQLDKSVFDIPITR